MISLVLFASLIGYLCGSLPFGIFIPKILGQGDPRDVGSKNVGATNVYRLAGFKSAFLVGLLDFLKGAFPVGLALAFFPLSTALAAGGGCVLGHIFPWILRFKGGKGVATACGAMALLMPLNTFVSLGVWIILWRKTGYVSLASLGASLTLLGLACLFYSTPYRLFALFITALIFYAHRHNLKRLLSGTEFRFRD